MSLSQRCFVSLALLFASAAAAGQEMDWWVINRFTTFARAEDFAAVEGIWAADKTAASTISSANFTRRLREVLPIERTAWRPLEGTYDKKILFPEFHRIKASLKGVAPETVCQWQIGDAEAAAAPCGESPPLPVRSGAAFRIKATPAGGPTYGLDVAAIPERLIVALGDSFASGEGNPDHPAQFHPLAAGAPATPQDWFVGGRGRDLSKLVKENARWWDEACHRSLLSWPAMAALGRAIENRREVVQFASFACSGAEIYDGILRAQADPPGDHAAGLVPGNRPGRDGGAGYTSNSGEVIDGQAHDSRLKLSQQHALANLLCADGKVKIVRTRTDPAPKYGVTDDQYYFGDVYLYGCSEGPKRKVDDLLISIGGNDVGFGGLVKWILTPDVKSWGQFDIKFIRSKLEVVSPNRAAWGISNLPTLYEVLSNTLSGLGIEGENVKLLTYPDPTAATSSVDVCNARTRDGNAPFQVMARSVPGKREFLFGINKAEYGSLFTQFIQPLRQAQDQAAAKFHWKTLDSQEAFRLADGSGTGYCSVSPACTKSTCLSGDRVKWWVANIYSDAPRLQQLVDFEAYDASRMRGMRYAVDALLSSAALTEQGKVRQDWLYGSAHPTANVHARIADILRKWW